MSFLLTHKDESTSKEKQIDSTLFSGDVILGSPSTSVDDLPAYMNSLYRLRDKCSFDEICLPHSVALGSGSGEGAGATHEDIKNLVVVDGPKKLAEYIEYRESRIA